MSRLLIYDTSNFVDFPIGGQLTSIGNFLRFVCEEYPERTKDIMLVGVTLNPGEIGKVKKIKLYGRQIKFLPVAAAERDLGNTSKSLRLMYVKGLLKCRKILKITKWDCNYIHTPEAYGVVKLFRMQSQCVIFSHGSYFNAVCDDFRSLKSAVSKISHGYSMIFCELKYMLKCFYGRILKAERHNKKNSAKI